MRRAHVYFASATLAMAMLLAGCGGSSSSSSATSTPASSAAPASSSMESTPAADASTAPATIDACTELTNDEIAGVIGTDPGVGTSDAANPVVCRYAVGTTNVVLASGADFDKIVANFVKNLPDAQQSDVTGLGDRAVMFTGTDGGGALFVLSGDATLGATTTSPDQATALVKLMIAKQ